MSTTKPLYSSTSAPTAITITATTLASGSARESLAVDNSTNLYDDALVNIKFTIGAGAPSGQKAVNVYAAGSLGYGNWGDNATGTDAALTMRSPTNLRLIGSIAVPTASLTYWSHPMSVAFAFGGVLPVKWSIIVENQCGDAFTAFLAQYTGVNGQIV